MMKQERIVTRGSVRCESADVGRMRTEIEGQKITWGLIRKITHTHWESKTMTLSNDLTNLLLYASPRHLNRLTLITLFM